MREKERDSENLLQEEKLKQKVRETISKKRSSVFFSMKNQVRKEYAVIIFKNKRLSQNSKSKEEKKKETLKRRKKVARKKASAYFIIIHHLF